MDVKVNAALSDGRTKAETTFKVIFLAEVIPEVVKANSAPYFLIKPQQIYVRFID